MNFQQARAEVVSYNTLISGWDGYFGEVFTSQTIARALRAIDLIEKTMGNSIRAIYPGPCSDGIISIEFCGINASRALYIDINPQLLGQLVCLAVNESDGGKGCANFWLDEKTLQITLK